MVLVKNPLIFSFETLNNIYLYVPFRHGLYKYSKKEFRKKVREKDKEYISKRILVEERYIDKFRKFYVNQLGEPSLKLLYIITTDDCNFRCKYCFIEGNYIKEDRKKLKWSIATVWIKYFYSNIGTKEPLVIFYGGEPLLNPDVVVKSINLIRRFDKKLGIETQIGINTNGSIFSKKLAKTFKKNRVTLSISIDGPSFIHDSMRIFPENKKTFTLVKNNIYRYHKEGVDISFSITISNHNFYFLPQIAKWVVDNFPFIKSVGFNPPLDSFMFRNDLNYSELMFNMYNAYRIFRYNKVYEDRVMRRIVPIVNEKPYLKDCAGCGNQIVLSPEGLIGPCHAFLGTKHFFKKHNLNFKFDKDKIFRLWNKISPVNKKDCYSCPFQLICGNACPYSSFMDTGDLFSKDKRMCKMMSIFMKELLIDIYYPKIKHIFIDLDGVLINTDVTKAISYINNKYNLNIEIPQTFFSPQKLFESYPNSNRLLREYEKILELEENLNDSLVRQLRKIKEEENILFSIVSSTPRERIKEKIDKYNLDFIDYSFSIKKKRDQILNLLEKLELQPEDILYIGDSFSKDIKPFYDLGIRSVQFHIFSSKLDNDWLVDLVKIHNEQARISVKEL